MRVGTWNVNSVQQRLPRLLPWLDERQPDVVCLQETKLSEEALGDLLAAPLAGRGYEAATCGQAQGNGVAPDRTKKLPQGRDAAHVSSDRRLGGG